LIAGIGGGSRHGHHPNPSMSSLGTGMYGMGLGPGPGGGNSFGRRIDRGRLSFRDGEVGAGDRSSGTSYVGVRGEEFGAY
jgi:hypothetical protein